jgi:PAS domain S-box-containing protein
VVSLIGVVRRHVELQIRAARDLLELRVLERTAELEQSNLELQESERNLRELTEAIPQQIWRALADGTIDYCNTHLLRFTGRTQDEMWGSRFFEAFHPEDVVHFQEAWTSALESRTSLEGEWRVRGSHAEFRSFLIRANAQFSSFDAISCWYGTHIDLEDWKRAELALAESQRHLAQLNRVMSMSEVTVSLAYEINQPLGAIVANGYACLGWLRLVNIEKAEASAQMIIQDGTRAAAIIPRLRALFRRGDDKRVEASINSIVLDAIRILRDESIRRHTAVRAQLAESLPMVNVDRVQIQQTLINLAINGMDSMEGMAAGEAELGFETTLDASGDVCVSLSDCGTGISPQLVGHIFEAFFTTKPAGDGVGLSISRSIIEAHQGKLWAASRPEGGSVFQFTLRVEQ